MSALALLLLVLVLWAIKELVVGILVWRRRRYLNHKLQVERTLRHFAETRNRLVQLAFERKIDLRSKTFQTLYNVNTYIMRRPDETAEISTMLRYTIIKNDSPNQSSSLDEESKTWTPEIKEVVRGTADALGYLVINYSRMIRWIYKLERRVNPAVTPGGTLKRLRYAHENKSSVLKEIRETQEKMYELAAV